ncbi:MAG: putative bifunctional diguanylate cyclase/phosphodiesterase [Thiotrichales bacterium]
MTSISKSTASASAPASLAADRGEVIAALKEKRSLSQKSGGRLGVVCLELQQFRRLGTSYGYDFTENLVSQVFERLAQELPKKDQVFYFGKNEFLILLVGLRVREQLKLALGKIARILDPFFSCDAIHHHLTIRAGAAIDEDVENVAELLRQADEALLRATERGEDQYIYTPDESEANQIPSLELQRELKNAINSSEVRAVFQPKTNLRTGEIVGVESLIRWQSEKFGFVSPDLMIAAAEESGLIIDLTLWTLKNAFQQYVRWGSCAVPIAVNLSPATLLDDSLPRMIENLRGFWDVPVSAVSLEVTETAFMDDPEVALERLERYHRMGYKLSIDDFGTGYSSLAYLKRMPVQEIKVDKAFVQHMDTDEKDRAIVKSVAALADSFGLRVVAEGIETVETYHEVMNLGCDIAQGYLISKPLPPQEFEQWSRKNAWYRPGRHSPG